MNVACSRNTLGLAWRSASVVVQPATALSCGGESLPLAAGPATSSLDTFGYWHFREHGKCSKVLG